jgi:predicted transposase/invertase (TIGR01784 family)
MDDILPPVNDWVFKLLFGDERNKRLLTGFLKSFVDLPEEEFELTLLDPHVRPETEDGKPGILDVKVRARSGQVIDIEIQVNPQREIGKRLSFYKSKMVVEQIAEGERYTVIQRVICICITSFRIFPSQEEYLNRFQYFNPKNGLIFEDVPEEIITVELPKVPKRDDGTAVWEWMDFLRSEREEEFEMAAGRNPDIREAVDTLDRLSGNREVRAQYEARMKAWRDWKTEVEGSFEDGKLAGIREGKLEGIREGKLEGIREGIREGKLEGQLDTARRMKAAGFSPEMITRISGLNPAILETLQAHPAGVEEGPVSLVQR